MTAETPPRARSPRQPVAPIRREVRVRCDADTAFELFTAHLGGLVAARHATACSAPGRVAFEDGVVVERRGTDQAVWGTVLRWERPSGFAMTWHPGQGPERATEVAVAFEPDGDGTLVTLTHTGWERLAEPRAGPRGVQQRLAARPRWLRRPAGRHAGAEPTRALSRRGAERRQDGCRARGAWFALHHRPGPALTDGELGVRAPVVPRAPRLSRPAARARLAGRRRAGGRRERRGDGRRARPCRRGPRARGAGPER